MAFRKKDKRLFRRYSRKKTCKIDVKGRSYKARTIDYSLDGLGVEVENGPPVNIGDVLDIEACYPGLKSSGEVVWAHKSENGTKMGLKRLGSLSGALEDFNLADVVLGLHRSRRTGMLHVVSGSVRKSVYFDGGDPIFASSTDVADRLGNLLLEQGSITREQFDRASKVVMMTGKRLGTVLVEFRAISPKDLFNAVTKTVENVIESIFHFKEGQFLFKEEPLPTEEVIKLSLSIGNLIYRGIKKIKDNEHIRGAAPPPDVSISFSSDPLYLFQDLKLDEADKRILKHIEGKKTVKELVEASGMEEIEAQKSIYALLSTRLIEVIEAQEEGIEISAESVVGEKEDEDYEEVAAKIHELYEKHEDLGYYGILGVSTTAANSEIKRAYYNMAKEFHPDKHYHLPAEMKDKLNTLFTYITTAYTTLTNVALRSEYDSRPKTPSGGAKYSNEQIAVQRFKDGMSEFERGRYGEAAQLFGAAAYLDNSIAKYHFYQGLALSKDGQFRDAERAISRALRAEPFRASYLAEAGHVYLALGLPKRAKGNFEKALNIEPRNKRALDGMETLDNKS